MISDALRADASIDVVGTANNGKDGIGKVKKLNPDVVVTDMMMPEYDGLYVVKEVMKQQPTPVILLSSLDKTTPEIFDALNAGAFDFVDKPQTKDSGAFKGALGKLIEQIKAASGLDSNILKSKDDRVNHNLHSFESNLQYDIMAVGSSTGGPSAVESLVTKLPANLAIPVVITQHMPERFLVSYAQRLSAIVPLPVRMAKRNQQVEPGVIYVAPGDGNMMIKRGNNGAPVFAYSKTKYKEFNNPSVDCLFESVGDEYGSKAIGIILTGMGKDGSNGLLNIKKKGGLTIAQDAESCVVNGMPKAAIDIGAVDYVVGLKEIPGFVMSCF